MKKIKVSDYIIRFLENITDSIFLFSGGASMHLVDSIGKSKLNAYCCHHEQGAAIAAEGYARIKNDLGIVCVTSGPGGTNAITGVAGAWLDSIPMLVISGQVKRDNIMPRKKGVPILRSLGFQEINIIDMVKPITKYAVMVEEEDQIRYHLEKAIYLAKTGRPGPVWLDIPLDIQATEINVKQLKKYIPLPSSNFKKPKIPMRIIIDELQKAKKPLMLIGNGVRLSGAAEILCKVLEKLKINSVTAMCAADDLVTYNDPYYLGRQGLRGNKAANYAVDNCDLLLTVGDRLNLSQTSYDYENFATQAIKIMVDIDETELHKKTVQIDIPVHCDAKYFLEQLYKQDIKLNKWSVEVQSINPDDHQGNRQYLNAYRFLAKLSKHSQGYDVIASVGVAKLGCHHALEINKGQRLFTSSELRHMGAGLPLAIGACIANNKKPVICATGDGSIMLNIQELQTVVHHQLPLKIFIFNNNGYYSIRNTHKRYFNKVFAADPDSGVSFPNFEKLIKAWGIKYEKISNDKDLNKVKKVVNYKGPIVCELILDPNQPLLSAWTAGQYREQKD